MPIEFACESCERLLRVPDGSEGGQCECPACKTLLVIPNPSEIANVGGEAASGSASQIKIACPKCTHTLRCDRSLIGTKGQCRKCQYIFVISETPNSADSPAGVDTESSEWTFTCPSCNQLFEGNEKMRGRKGKCHSCGEVFAIELQRASDQRPSESPSQDPSPKTPTSTPRSPASSKTPTQKPATKNQEPKNQKLKNQAPEKPATGNSGTVQTGTQHVAQPRSPERPATTERATGPSPTPVSAAIQIACPSCEGVMEVPSSAAGQRTACPYCQQLLEIPAVSEGTTHSGSAASTEPTVEPQSEELPEPAWSELGDLSGALDSSTGPLDNASSPYIPPAGEWAAPRTIRRSGLTFSNAFGLTFERAFPACLAGSLIYMLISGAAGLISWLILFFTSWGLQSAGFRPDSPSDMNIVWTVIIISIIFVTLLSILLVAVGFSIICNGALAVIRKKNYDSAELFSTGGAYMPILVYLFILTVVSSIPSLVMYGIIQLAPTMAMLALLITMLLSFFVFLFYVATCMAPFAILDGEGPFEALGVSMRITAANPVAVFGTIICVYIIFMALAIVSCGILAILGVGFPFYAMAACYHLGTK